MNTTDKGMTDGDKLPYSCLDITDDTILDKRKEKILFVLQRSSYKIGCNLIN